MQGIEQAYTALLVLALVLNGVVLTGSTTVRTFFAPLRETRLITSVVGLDSLVVPIVIIGLAVLFRVDDVTRAGLVIVAAASAGPIGVALTRVARGDTALSVALVTGIGLLNLATVPLITGLLLPDTVPFPTGPIVTSLVTLLLLPLVLGRLFAAALSRTAASEASGARVLGILGRLSTASLAGAVTLALFLEPELVRGAVVGPVTPIAVVTMAVVTLVARAITTDPARRRTIAVVINARAVGLALTITALHFGDVPGLRATVLTYGGLTQLVPILVVLAARGRVRTVRR